MEEGEFKNEIVFIFYTKWMDSKKLHENMPQYYLNGEWSLTFVDGKPHEFSSEKECNERINQVLTDIVNKTCIIETRGGVTRKLIGCFNLNKEGKYIFITNEFYNEEIKAYETLRKKITFTLKDIVCKRSYISPIDKIYEDK